MSTFPNLLGWFFPRRQAQSEQISGLLTKPHSILANYRHGRAIVETPILPGRAGRVWFKGSWWPARCPQELALLQGQAVRVIDIDRITLIVEPLTETLPEATPQPPPQPLPQRHPCLRLPRRLGIYANRQLGEQLGEVVLED